MYTPQSRGAKHLYAPLRTLVADEPSPCFSHSVLPLLVAVILLVCQYTGLAPPGYVLYFHLRHRRTHSSAQHSTSHHTAPLHSTPQTGRQEGGRLNYQPTCIWSNRFSRVESVQSSTTPRLATLSIVYRLTMSENKSSCIYIDTVSFELQMHGSRKHDSWTDWE